MARIVENPTELQNAYSLRARVFIDEQGVPEDMERDADDETALHAIEDENGVVIGTGRMVIEGTRGRIGRMAVEKELRGRGIGSNIMRAFEQKARELHLTELYLHAQTHAQKFYADLGYVPRGEIFEEAGIEHIEMFKSL